MTEDVKNQTPIPQENDMPENENPDNEKDEQTITSPEPEESPAPSPAPIVPQPADFKDYPIIPFKPNPDKSKKKKSRFPAVLTTVLIMIPFTAVVFVAGLLIGGEYGISSKKVNVAQIPLMETLKTAVENITEVPLTLTITEEQLNTAVIEAKDQFTPIKNLNVSIKNQACTLSGQINTADIKTIAGESVPEMLYLFLPETLNLKADFTISKEDPTMPEIKNLSVLNMENSEEFIRELGLDNYIESIIKNKLTESLPPYVKISSFEIQNGKILCNATVHIFKEESPNAELT